MLCPEAILRLARENDLSISLLARSGSRAYGIDVPESDDDFVGTFIAPARQLLSVRGLDHDSLAGNDPDFTLHEIGKFCALALKGNPAILETLWNSDVVMADEWGRELLVMRRKVLHRGSLAVYVGYAEAQLKHMVKGKGLHAKGGAYGGKYGGHLIRLLHSGIDLAKRHEVTVRVAPELAAMLLKIRRQELSMGDVLREAEPLLRELKRLSAENTLPEKPDFAAVDDLVVRARLSRM